MPRPRTLVGGFASLVRACICLALALLPIGCYARSAAGSEGGFTIVDSIVLHDATRHRDIPLKIYAPANGNAVPLLIFSHGFGSNKDGYVYLAQAWAAAGYAVIVPTHLGGDRAALLAKGYGAVLSGEAVSAGQLQDNARDISFIIASLDNIARLAPQLAGVIDPKRIGVAGHSMGAGTVMVLDGATLPGLTATVSDPRVLAFIAISPQGMASSADAHRWDGVARPTFTIYGSNDIGAQGQPPTWRQDPFDRMPPSDKYNLIVEGANHFSFADKPESAVIAELVSRGQTRDIGEIHDEVARATLLFWNAYLENDDGAKAALEKLATEKK